jgi:hypothetical protein
MNVKFLLFYSIKPLSYILDYHAENGNEKNNEICIDYINIFCKFEWRIELAKDLIEEQHLVLALLSCRFLQT